MIEGAVEDRMRHLCVLPCCHTYRASGVAAKVVTMTNYIWREAEVGYPDWKGTIQVDERKTGRQLNELVGLNDNWMIIGLDIGGGEHDHHLKVLAVDGRIAPDGGDIYPRIAAAHNGDLPVTEFLIHDADPYEILKAMTHMLDLRLRVRNVVDIPIRIEHQGDVPEQG